MNDEINNQQSGKNLSKSLDQEQSPSTGSTNTPKSFIETNNVGRYNFPNNINSNQNVENRMKINQLVNAAKGNVFASVSDEQNLNRNNNFDPKGNPTKTIVSPSSILNETGYFNNKTLSNDNGRLLSPNNGNTPYQSNNFNQMFSFNLKPRGSITSGTLPLPTQKPFNNNNNSNNNNVTFKGPMNPLNQQKNNNNDNIPSVNETKSGVVVESRQGSVSREPEKQPSPLSKGDTVHEPIRKSVKPQTNIEPTPETTTTETKEPKEAEKTTNTKRSSEAVNTTDTEPETKPKKPRKKRKVYSCQACRKMKTRCDFQPLIAKCHRCVILDIPCSLGEERKEDIKQALEAVNKTNAMKNVFDSNNSGKNMSGERNMAYNSGTLGLEQNKLQSQHNIDPGYTEKLAYLQNDISFLNTRMNSIEDKLNIIINHLASQATNATVTSHPPSSSSLSSSLVNGKNYNTAFQIEMQQEPPKLSNHGVTTENPPFRLLDQIEKELFGTYDDSNDNSKNNRNLTEREILAKAQRAWVVARQKFMEFFYNHEALCFKLAHAFLKKAHFWIIPGGIKTIDREYVEKHPFITSVFAIIAMGFDENENFSTEQEILYPIVERLLSNTLTMFDQLHDHDIEAILYISMYTISRKSKKFRQVKFDGLILSKFATDSLLNLIDFHKIKENVENGLFDGNDLFHLRILNSLTCVKMEYSVGYCNFSIQDKQLKDFNDLTVRFPQSTFGDEIKLGEIKLGDIVNGFFLNFDDFYDETLRNFKTSSFRNIIKINEMENWLETYTELSSKDGSNLLIFTYDFFYIVICRTILFDFASKDYNKFLENKDFFIACLNTVKKYCFAILTAFLKLPTSLIKGAPIISLQQTVYSCLSLCDFLHCFNTQEKARILNLCTKIYWHLNSIGEQLNEATQNVGIIIKTLIDSSMVQSVNQNMESRELALKDLFIQIQNGCRHNSIKRKKTKSSNRNKDNHSSITSVNSKKRSTISQAYTPGTHSNVNTISNTATPLSNASLNKLHSEISDANNHRHINQFNFGNILSPNSFNFPDVDQFQTFEDFFQDFFQNSLKPKSQNMFQGK